MTAAGSVVVVHHMPGFDRATKEIARRFVELGYNAIMPNLNYRDAPGASSDDAAAATRAAGGVPDERLIGDVAGAQNYLLSLSNSNGKSGIIGYCSGGRQSVLAACNIKFDAAVDCYGAYVMQPPASDSPLAIAPISDQLVNLSCSLLGLFGDNDMHPSQDEVALLAKSLDVLGKDFDFHSFANAGHAFFSPSRPSYQVDAANRGWELIIEFFQSRVGGSS